MNKKIVQISAFFVLISSCALAQTKDSLEIIESKFKNISVQELKEVVISDSKFALSKEKSGKVITKITAEDLKNRAGESIATILSSVAGVEINGNQSGTGKNLGLYIRGGKSNQVLVLIDGIPVIDASGINLEYDLNLLSADQVESIEIMKGAASTLYGTGAATGVINIRLKKSDAKKIEGNYNLSIGTNNTAATKKTSGQDVNQGFSVNGNSGKINYFATIYHAQNSGMSQIAEPIHNIEYEEDRFSKTNYLAKLGYKLNSKLTFDFFANYDKTKSNLDASFSNSGADDNQTNKSNSGQFRFGFSPKFAYDKGAFTMNTSFSKTERDYYFSGSILKDDYKARSINIDAFNKYIFRQNLFLIAGVQYQFHDMDYQSDYANIVKENTKFNMIDPYFSIVYNSNLGLNINTGARLNTHSQYGNEGVFNINPSFEFNKSVKILGSVSTAFVTPSLYQLYSEYGNPDLKPEKNMTVEAGFETKLIDKKLTFNVVGFYREQKNFIGFGSKYINIDGINNARGVEAEIAFKANDKIKLNANYSFTQVDEALDLLIPKHKVNGNIDFQIKKSLFLGINYQYIDGRKDLYFDTSYIRNDVSLSSYQLLNTTIRYEMLKNRMTIFGNCTNILNAEFVENVGYNTRGRNFKLGLNIKI